MLIRPLQGCARWEEVTAVLQRHMCIYNSAMPYIHEVHSDREPCGVLDHHCLCPRCAEAGQGPKVQGMQYRSEDRVEQAYSDRMLTPR